MVEKNQDPAFCRQDHVRLAGKGNTSRLQLLLRALPMDCQCDAQTQELAGSAISHEYIGGNVEEGLLLGLARRVCSFASSG